VTRKLPLLTPENSPFWQGGANARLLIARCDDCRRWQHPPGPVCRACGSREVHPRPASGRGRVFSFTINHQRWTPELEVPNVIAIVELEEQPGLRFISNIVDCPVQAVAIGMPVRVRFLQQEDVWLPLFAPAHDAAQSGEG
jgi:uncharacterized OB-fold protein